MPGALPAGLAVVVAVGTACSSPAEPIGGGPSDHDEGSDRGDGGPVCDELGSDARWDELPDLLRCTGLYADFTRLTIADGVMPYTPGLALWSDGADKQRYLWLPPGGVIDTTDMDEWRFPIGTRVWKEFRLGGARIETRLLYKRSATEWLWTTYRWPDDGGAGGGDAVRLDEGATGVVDSYEIPSADSCGACHDGRLDKVLGLEAIASSLPDASGVTLDGLGEQGLLSAPPAAGSAALPEDATGLAGRALGILHMNCGVSCHNQNTGSGAFLSGFHTRLPAAAVLEGGAAADAMPAWTTAAGVPPQSTDYAAQAEAGYLRLAPGEAARSLIPHVMELRGDGRMPPLATHEIDTAGREAVSAWIGALARREPTLEDSQ